MSGKSIVTRELRNALVKYKANSALKEFDIAIKGKLLQAFGHAIRPLKISQNMKWLLTL